MSQSVPGKADSSRGAYSREILIFDVLLVILNIVFVGLIYHQGKFMIAASSGAGVEFSEAIKIFLLLTFWAAGNIVLLFGLARAMRRAGTL